MPLPHRLIASGVLGGGPTWVTPTDIPAAEAAALKSLYDLTNGAGWTNKTNWGKTATAANWYGITVAAGKVVTINLNTNNLSGSITTWAVNAFTALYTYYLYTNASLTGSVAGHSIPATVRYVSLHTTGLSGSISGHTLSALLINYSIHTTSITGTPSFASADALAQYNHSNCGLLQANVDATCLAIATRFSAGGFTAAAPALTLGGTNAAPSGAYADEDPPSTGLGAVFEICTDPETLGFPTWTATVTGSGPYP